MSSYVDLAREVTSHTPITQQWFEQAPEAMNALVGFSFRTGKIIGVCVGATAVVGLYFGVKYVKHLKSRENKKR